MFDRIDRNVKIDFDIVNADQMYLLTSRFFAEWFLHSTFSIRIIECVSKSIEDVDTPDRLIYLSDWEYLGEIRLVHAPGYSRFYFRAQQRYLVRILIIILKLSGKQCI